MHNKQASREVDRGDKPFAPLEALLPATRLKLIVDRSSSACILFPRKDERQGCTIRHSLQQLNDILSHPPKLFTSPKVSKQSSAVAQLTTGVSSINKEQYKRNRSSLGIANGIPATLINHADVERQWGMLQYQESKLEQENEMRGAFTNYYTSRLDFGNSYLLTAFTQDRKRLIRNEHLPTVAAVITSDLDMRELHRNTFLTTHVGR
jgi:hypothetical protein